AVQHLGPVRSSHPTGHAEGASPGQRREEAQPPAAAEEIAEQASEVMNEDEIPVQEDLADEAVLQREGEEEPVQRVGRARLHLSDERLPTPFVGIPKREFGGVEGPGLNLNPGDNLVGGVRAIEPGKL